MGAVGVVVKQAAGAVVRTACTPNLGDRRQAGVDVLLAVDCLSLLERDGGHMTGHGEEDRDYLFGSASRVT